MAWWRAAVGCTQKENVATTEFAKVGQGHPCETHESWVVWEDVALEVTVLSDATTTGGGDQSHTDRWWRALQPIQVLYGLQVTRAEGPV